MRGTRTELDERDATIVAQRLARLDAAKGPREGDWIEFADGAARRVAYVWPAEAGGGVQSCDGGSFYLGDGYVSMSGSLYGSVPDDSLTDTGDARPGSCWIFHHDWHTKDNGIDAEIPFRVYRCSLPAPR